MSLEEVHLTEDQPFMTIGQLLKYVGLISTGGQAKWFLQEVTVILNGEIEQRRGKKLIPGDRLSIEGHGDYIVKSPLE
ncbi:RNA-binding S4 domain-containing protein [Pullulanibacillus sp. KACC 23026]|uniref:RNA-binding S4 domain-containing protein n=1 Tax=Pullulanibacillus sp. KACC 23026 TaxID=3028315 RepID=UPI0023AFD578|nr:RNA-binding S4 domain-containing protein [Pullulanibacillus sp. KACC 23026]WEG12781.1 RNA-binding S4 domain-containing protein [Pullulanibacillus sp. KACC 23026]